MSLCKEWYIFSTRFLGKRSPRQGANTAAHFMISCGDNGNADFDETVAESICASQEHTATHGYGSPLNLFVIFLLLNVLYFLQVRQ